MNPAFEGTLKRNLVNAYCRQAAYEPEQALFLPENAAYYDWVRENLRQNVRGEWAWTLDGTEDALYNRFMATPLSALCPPCDRTALPQLLRQAADAAARIQL